MAAYRDEADKLHRYPDGSCLDLREAIGARHGLAPERLVCGAGSDELINLLVRAYMKPGDELLYSAHGFAMYPINALQIGATPVTAPEVDYTASVDNLLDRVTGKTRMVCLANPNNPTGTYVTRDEVERLHAALPKDVLLLIDAAYAEFISRNDYEPGVELVDRAENVVMTRTFSKIYGLGGLRLGWMYVPEHVADAMSRLRQPFNVSVAAEAAGIAAVNDTEHVERSVEHNARWRAWLTGQLAGLGLEVTPSVCNFVMVHFPSDGQKTAEAADEFLNSRGIITRRIAGYGLPDSLRITIGLEDEMHATADALADFMQG
jgi:histidinol-phosphate aminotransferase